MTRLATIRRGTLATLVAVMLTAVPATPADAGCANTAFIGEICTFAFNFCPQGFAEAAGQVLPIHDNVPLFTLLGSTFGGDGVNTFALPDLRGALVAGTGQAPGQPAAIGLGQSGGTPNTVSVVAADPPAGVPVPLTQLPSLGLTQCIATAGVFPSRN